MSIILNDDRSFGGTRYAAGSTISLDGALEINLVAQGLARWAGEAPYQGGATYPASFSVNAAGNVTGLMWAKGLLYPDVPWLGASANRDTDWTRLYGPNELDDWAVGYGISSIPKVNEIFRREGAALKFDSLNMTENYGSMSTSSASLDLSAGGTIGILVYVHRKNSATNTAVRLYLGTSYTNCKKYTWAGDRNTLHEGWNFLLVHTATPETNGQNDYQTGGVLTTGWETQGTGHDFANPCTYVRFEVDGMRGANYPITYLEGIYFGGKDKRIFTIGFDIQTAPLLTAKSVLDAYGFVGYAAVPTGNGDESNPQYLWSSADKARLQSLYSAGWDIIPHSVSHNPTAFLLNPQRIADEFEACQQQITALGCTRGIGCYVSPNGSFTPRSNYVLAQQGVRWQRNTVQSPLLQSTALVGIVNGLGVGGFSPGGMNRARIRAGVDLFELYGVPAHFYSHEVWEGGDNDTPYSPTSQLYTYHLEQLCERLVEGGWQSVTPSEYIRRCAGPTKAMNVLRTPTRQVLTPPASPATITNVTAAPVMWVVSGGTVSEIAYSRDGTTFDVTGATAGQFVVQPGDALKITYSSVPAMVQYGLI